MADIGQILELCQEAWDTSFHSHLEMDRGKTLQTIRTYIKSDRLFSYVSEVDGEVVGALGGYCQAMDTSDALAASDQFFYFKDVPRETMDAVKLLKRFIKWAKKNDADMITMYCSHGSERGERAGSLLKSVGLTRSGSVYYWTKGREVKS